MIRSIDKTTCTGCGSCFKSCPLDVFRLDTNQEEISPCMEACPAGSDIRTIHYLLQQGRPDDALQVLKRTMPLPAITGRVCFHPCEAACSRQEVDQAVQVNALEQFLGDMDLRKDETPVPLSHISPVAVIGSGPAGLSCAWYLTRAGYPVTVFESNPLPGGMLRYGIPAYRLPDRVIDRQIEKFRQAGIIFKCGIVAGIPGTTLSDLSKQGFRAIFLAPGASKGNRPPLIGEEAVTVWSGLDFLRAIRSEEKPAALGRVVVVGGGDVAMDAAISARRLGAASVDLICLEEDGAMPAHAHNIIDAHDMGIPLHCGWGADRIETGSLICKRCTSLVNEVGNFAPSFDPTELMELQADTLVMAVGQRSDLEAFAADLEIDRGRLIVDPLTLETSRQGVFAAGDAVTGPASVVGAIAGGRRAALSIHRYLSGSEMRVPQEKRPVVKNVSPRTDKDKLAPLPACERKLAEPPHGKDPFAEFRLGLDFCDCLAESLRCLTCGSKAVVRYSDDCMTCYTCEVRCPSGAVDVHPFKERLPLTLESMEGNS